jgi:hypothetical protein
MKKSLYVRAGAALIAFPLIVLFQAPAGSASDGGESAGAPLSEASCSDSVGVFPTSVYTRLTTGPGGSISGFEIHVSYSGGDCSSILYSSSAVDNGAFTKAHQNKEDSVIILR